MIACICGFEAMTEAELTAHFECHRLPYGLEPCGEQETSGDPGAIGLPSAA